MFNQNFFPLINCPTRITDTYASAIDHIWTNVTCTNIKSGILIHDISDHLPKLQISEIGKLQQNLPAKVYLSLLLILLIFELLLKTLILMMS